MSQVTMGRAHVALDAPIYAEFGKMSMRSAKAKKITVGALIAAAVFCALDKFEVSVPKGKPFSFNKVKIDPTVKDDLKGEFVRMHVYFGKDTDVYERITKLSAKAGVSIGWLVRMACLVCVSIFKVKVAKGKNFKCLGKTVTID